MSGSTLAKGELTPPEILSAVSVARSGTGCQWGGQWPGRLGLLGVTVVQDVIDGLG